MTKYVLFLVLLFAGISRVEAQTVPPSTCSVGEILIDSGGQSEYWCISTNHWLVRPISTLDYVHLNVPYGVPSLDQFGVLNPSVIPSSVLSGAAGRITTVSGLPAATSSNLNTFWFVTDGANSTDCSTGGGTNIVGCRNNSGSAWTGVAIGGSGGGSGGLSSAGAGLSSSGSTVYLPSVLTSSPGTYTFPSLTVDAFGRITSVSSNTAITSVGAGLATSGTGTVVLPAFSGVAGSYTNANIVVDSYGRVTTASNGSAGSGGGVSSLSGAVTGSASATKLRDFNSALDYGSTTTGIAQAVTNCGSTPCVVIVPGGYPTTEQIPGQGLTDFVYPNTVSASTIGSNVMIEDYRYGGEYRVQNNPVGNQYSNNQYANNWNINYTSQQTANWDNVFGFNIIVSAVDGGTNDNTSLFSSKINYQSFVSELNSWTSGQHIGLGSGVRSYSVGDSLPFSFSVYCWGGYNAASDEGCQGGDQEIFMGYVEAAGTISGSASTGYTSITISPSQGAGTQGSERFILNTTGSKIITGTASSISSALNAFTTVSLATTIPASSAYGTLNTNITGHGTTATITPTFTYGSMASIAAGTIVCVGGAENFEQVVVTSTTSTTWTAYFYKSHGTSPATDFGVGGACGYNFDFTADDVTDGTFSGYAKINPIQGTLHRAWPVIYSTSNSATLWVSAAQELVTIPTSFQNVSGKNAFTLYPSALIKSTMYQGGVSNNLTLYPNSVPWASGDGFTIPLYPMNRVSGGNFIIESFQAGSTNANASGLTVQFNGINDGGSMMAASNNTPAAFYQKSGGNYNPPTGLTFSGESYFGIGFNYMPDRGGIYFNCDITGCTNQYATVMLLNDALSYDVMYFDQVHGEWTFTSDGQSGSSYRLSSGTIMSNKSTNTDFVGSLTFSAATSATQSLTGRYTTHPQCWAEPQFDQGSGVRRWITYSGTSSFTVNFSSAVTGTVSYSCIGMN